MGKKQPSNTQPQNIMLCWCCISWIALTYAALHNFDDKAADIQNAKLQAPSSEKISFIAVKSSD